MTIFEEYSNMFVVSTKPVLLRVGQLYYHMLSSNLNFWNDAFEISTKFTDLVSLVIMNYEKDVDSLDKFKHSVFEDGKSFYNKCYKHLLLLIQREPDKNCVCHSVLMDYLVSDINKCIVDVYNDSVIVQSLLNKMSQIDEVNRNTIVRVAQIYYANSFVRYLEFIILGPNTNHFRKIARMETKLYLNHKKEGFTDKESFSSACGTIFTVLVSKMSNEVQ